MSAINSNTKAVVLDIDGTLCSLTKGVGEIYVELLAQKGLSIEPLALNQAVVQEWQGFLPLYLNESQGYRTSLGREREVWCEYVRRVLARVGVRTVGQDDLVNYIYGAFATKDYRAVAPGALEFIMRLRERGIHVVAATNNDERSKSVLRELGVLDKLSGAFTAGDLGWKKPSPRFYETLEQRLGFKPSALVHVGNSIALDIEPAQQAGWRAIYFGSSNEIALYSVGSFAALEEMFGL